MHAALRDLYAVLWGATWANNLAWLESLAATGLVLWVKRDAIGKRAAAWWNRHHREHAIELHLEALRRHEEAKRQQEGSPL